MESISFMPPVEAKDGHYMLSVPPKSDISKKPTITYQDSRGRIITEEVRAIAPK